MHQEQALGDVLFRAVSQSAALDFWLVGPARVASVTAAVPVDVAQASVQCFRDSL